MLLDQSESMEPYKQTTLQSVNNFIQGQKNQTYGAVGCASMTKTLFTLVFFSDTPTIVITETPIEEVEMLTEDDLSPSGMTALYDAIGFVISSLIPMDDDKKTICCVITDGEENHSKNFTQSAITHLIASRGESLNMIFLGSNQDAVTSGSRIGLNVMDCLTYEDDDVENVFECLGSKIRRVRHGETTRVAFLENDRKKVATTTSTSTYDDFEENEEEEDEESVFVSLGGRKK